jgi:CelD/BcsL family acetyltransferase involved in cellulose biosynthesis
MQAQWPPLRRAFLTPRFALACEKANGRAYVAVLHNGGVICGFFPFQFRSAWHHRLRIAERIGGGLCDAAGLVAAPDLRVTGPRLVRAARLASMQVSHLVADQERLGLDADWCQSGYITDLSDGPDAYFEALLKRDRPLVRDTERCLRKIRKDCGEPVYLVPDSIAPGMVAELIASKRAQYHRTNVPDPFARTADRRLLHVLRDMPADECRVVVSRLEVGGHLLAQHLGVRHGEVMSYWFPAYDRAARSVSPGRLLLWNIIQSAGEAGIRLIDYGEGAAAYKREFATGSVRYGRVSWYGGGVGSALARLYEGLEWRLRARSHRWLPRPT